MRYKTIVIMTIVMSFCSACANTSSQTPSPSIPETSSQLFVEYWIDVIGTTSKERCDNFVYIDGPNYRYEENNLLSVSEIDLTIGKGIIGCGKQINYPAGSGVFSNLYPIKDFPYAPEWPDYCQTLTINNIDISGTISAKVNGKTVSLPVEQEWTDSIADNSDSSCRKIITYRLTNFGFIESDQIDVPKK
jgi:hypothetical protein